MYFPVFDLSLCCHWIQGQFPVQLLRSFGESCVANHFHIELLQEFTKYRWSLNSPTRIHA